MDSLNGLYAERGRLLAEIDKLYSCYEKAYFDSVEKVVLLASIITLRQQVCDVQKQIVEQLIKLHLPENK